MVALAPISLTASITLDPRHSGTILVANAAAGLTATLPAATGSGRKYELVVGTTITSNNLIVQVANADDVMTGVALFASDNTADASVAFETASTTDTITMDGSTKGGIKGDRIELQDIADNLWYVRVIGSATGTEVTPFSAAVS
jgi:hypothetical protein